MNRLPIFPTVPLVDGVVSPEQGSVALVSTNVSTLAVFHNKTTYQSKTNKVKAVMLQMHVTVDIPATGEGEVTIQLIGNPTLSDAPTYTSIDANNSIIEYDHTPGTGASVDYASGGKVVHSFQLSYSASTGNQASFSTDDKIEAERIGAVAYPDNSFVLLAKDLGGNAVTVRFHFVWEELL